MRKSLTILLIISLLFVSHKGRAQKITVTASIDSSQIFIGEHAHLLFEIAQQPNQKVLMPQFGDSLAGLEVIERFKPDTVKSADGHLLVKQRLTVTGYADSLMYIPEFPYVSGSDTVWSKSLSLKVIQPFKIDTASHKICDIKGVYTPPINLMGILLALLAIIGLHGLIVLGIILYRKYYGKNAVEAAKVEVLLPPFVVAINQLDRIKKEKIWQQGLDKEYHTELTDVIREYIERSFDVHSMEMTSEEIMDHLRFLRVDQKAAYAGLKQILNLADLVKFAKYTPAPNEHEQSLMNAYLFVNQTKKEDPKPLADVQSEEKKSE